METVLPDDSLSVYNFLDPLPIFCRDEYLPIGIRALNQIMQGGLRKKELGVVIAVYQNGKSAMLTSIAAKNYLSGKKVLHFVFEDHIGDVYHAHERILKNQAKMQTKEEIEKNGGRLWLVDGASEAVPLDKIDKMLAKYQPDLCVIDYGEKIPYGNGVKSWKEIAEVYTSLRRLANKHNLALWTAQQATIRNYADGTPVKEITPDRVAECKLILAIADVCFGITRIPETTDRALISVLKLKHRPWVPIQFFQLGVDWAIPKFWSLS